MMMMMVCASPGLLESNRIPSVVVVDPRFDEYKLLAASARQGRLQIHFRTSGAAALKLARHLDVDAWLVATDLDDMSGRDLVTLLDRERAGDTKLITVGDAGDAAAFPVEGDARGDALVDGTLSHPISIEDIELLLGVPAASLAARHDQFTLRQGGSVAGLESAQGRFPRSDRPSPASLPSAEAS